MVVTRNRSYSESRQRPTVVSQEGTGTPGRGIVRLNNTPSNLGNQLENQESSSVVSSLDTSFSEGSTATPHVQVGEPTLPRQITTTASLPARPPAAQAAVSATKKTPVNKKAAMPASKKKARTPGSASSTRTLNPARTNKAGLPLPDQQVIAQEIENRGGLFVVFAPDEVNPLHNLCEECSKDPAKGGTAIWGAAKTETGRGRRQQIKDKTRQWRELSQEEWEELCRSIEVNTARVIATRAAVFGRERSGPKLESKAQPTRLPTTKPKKRVAMSEHRDVSGGGNQGKPRERVIHIDSEFPEENEPVFVTPFHQFKFRGAYYSGFDIQVVADMRELEDDCHVLKHESATDFNNMLLYTKPAWAITYTKDKDAYENFETVPQVKVGHAVSRTTYTKSKLRAKRTYKLQFPSHCKLTNDPFRDMTDGGDQELESKLIFIRFDTGRKDKNNKAIPSFVVRASWKVIDLSTKNDANDGSGKKKGAKQLDDVFAALDLDTDEAMDDFTVTPPVSAANSPAPSPAKASPNTTSKAQEEQKNARIQGACAVVATEFSTTVQEVYNALDLEACCRYSDENELPIVDVIREAYSRTVACITALRTLSREFVTDYTRLTNACNWWGMLDEAQAANCDVTEYFREQYKKYLESQKKPKAATKKNRSNAEEVLTERFKIFKGRPSRKDAREEENMNRAQRKKDLKLKAIRKAADRALLTD